jgi:type I restriction enzyme S subunit
MAFPKLRFKNAEGAEFTSWVTSFIGDECKITTGNKDTQNKIDGGKYPFFVRSQTVERINTYSKDCEAILTSGDGVGVGKNYHYINGKFDFHQRVYCLYDFSNQLLGKYLYIYFSNYFFDRVKRLSAKNSVDSVRMDMISKMEIKLPSLVEQTKIASFLTAVDEKISQLSQKHELLSQYKQGMMQKLFNQQIRFKADDGSEFGEWEDKTISDIASYRRGSFPQPYGLPEWLDENGFPFVQVYDVAENMLLKDKTKIKISQLAANQSVLAKAGTLIITLQGSIGRVAKMQYDAYVDRTLLIFQSYAMPIDTDYFKYALYLLFNIEKEKADGGIIKTITKETLSKFNIGIPCLEEQTKIANFLSAIDQKIDVASEQLEQAKLWKKGLLQQMFV